MRPTLSKKHLVRDPPSTPSYSPLPGPNRSAVLAKNAKIPALVLLPHGKSLLQRRHLPRLPGQIGFAGDRPHRDAAPRTSLPNEALQNWQEHDSDNPFYVFSHDAGPDAVDPQVSRNRRKREKQWERWIEEVIPQLIGPYMRLMCATQSMREPIPASQPCLCGLPGRRLEVMLVRFDSLERIFVTVCNCAPAAVQLVARGFFPSAPLAPTLGVDMKVLDFVASLFVNVAPNNTAWCKTVETFLSKRGYKLTTEDSLRKRFGNALHWYNVLQDESALYVDNLLGSMRRAQFGIEDGIKISLCETSVASSSRVPDSPTLGSTRCTVTPNTPHRPQHPRDEEEETPSPTEHHSAEQQGTPAHGSKRRRSGTGEDTCPSNPFPTPLLRIRPSDYLRSRCPLCFGGIFSSIRNESQPHAIVCIDACFTQKRNHQARDPPHTHPRTVFVDEGKAIQMENYVESLRPSKAKKTKRSRNEPQDEEDGYEGSLRVPRSVLDDCESSFTAADSRREKASTQFFDDTALMALVCRHDIVLFLVNMRSAGEKQHYVIVLLETLFQHLPTWFTIGLLYDIGCQLERSCVKWGFLDRYVKRIIFGISVFHAFGHQWPCQIIYHPRKREGFGLTDGEGCERVWHSISKLIAYLRVCGYHQRLYTLDRQVNHMQTESLERFGMWLLRRSHHVIRKREVAEATLLECGHSDEFLRAQWAAQVRAQTKPLPRQSKTKGQQAVEEAIRLRKARDVLKDRVREFELVILDADSAPDAFADAEMGLSRARELLSDANARIRTKEAALGVRARQELQTLVNSPFVSVRMNARALKVRLRDRLRFRKFELDRLERSFRKQVNDQKINAHTASSVNRREPTIQRLAQDYNRLCDTMAQMIKDKKAPRGAQCPPKIATKGLFALDVDDSIWQDVGLDDDEDPEVEPPLWLSNDSVRSSIKAMLERDRCLEEQARLRHECRSLRQWFSEEWAIVNVPCASRDAEAVNYELQLRRIALCRLCAAWQKQIQSLDFGDLSTLPEWGPSPEEIVAARVSRHMASVNEVGEEGDLNRPDGIDDEDGLDIIEADETDLLLVDALDAVDLADAFRSMSTEESHVYFNI
ncbi:hypothetical protein FPV67DRAFT_1403470 [Lyophyllum atratum]|nr:hypothetical protein FPV67DRAFT_1403470 [Lyophyllum atratum]